MTPSVNTLIPWLAAFVITIALTTILRGRLHGRALTIVSVGGVFLATMFLAIFAGKLGASVQQTGSDNAHARAVDLMKGVVALTALGCVFYELHRVGQRRPIAERWKKLIGVILGCAGIVLYFNAFKWGYPKYYHRHDQYHYYMGAKYFPEIGYDGLYKCTAIAQDEIGVATVEVDGRTRPFDVRGNVRKPGKLIRNLSGDNLLMKVDDLLADHSICTKRFTPKRWEQYKRDVTFFATQAYLDDYWDGMQKDHGYNPPPVWTMLGYLLGNAHDASVLYMQFLGCIDVVFILGAFIALWWAFGWRGFAVAGVLWGCQASAPYYWTGGAMLRQDWFFFFVFAVCLARKRYMGLAAASLVYSALLRVFPGLAVMGWLVVAGAHLVKHRSLKKEHLRMLVGGTAAAAVLILASIVIVGKDSYKKFYHHTIEVHDQTPLTNHMGLRVVIGHDVGFDKESGRMKFAKEGGHIDPFDKWKQMRNDRYKAYKPVAYSLIAVSLIAFIAVVRRIKNMWIAQCVSQIWIILLSQLTCYYYSFVIISAPLARARRSLEAYMFGFAAFTQIGWRTVGMNDDKYTLLTLMSMIFCYFLLFSFAARELPSSQKAKGELVATNGGLAQVLEWSGPRLGALVSFVPGLVFAVMGALKRDVSTVIIGAISMGGGIGLAVWVQRARAKAMHTSGSKPNVIPPVPAR
ncbi:MAG: hypothetical protein U0271_28995 [Polyangiaceae bacterium]